MIDMGWVETVVGEQVVVEERDNRSCCSKVPIQIRVVVARWSIELHLEWISMVLLYFDSSVDVGFRCVI